MGRFERREAIRTHFQRTSSVMGFAIHHVTNPIIDIQSDTAQGQCIYGSLVLKANNNFVAPMIRPLVNYPYKWDH